MSVELKDDWTTRELIDRCVRAEMRAHIFERQAEEYREAVQMAIRRGKTLEAVRARLQAAIQADLTLIAAEPR